MCSGAGSAANATGSGAEIQRNREGNHKIPTWVLATILGLILLAWLLLILLS